MTPSRDLTVNLYSGWQALTLAPDLWASMDTKARRAMLWDIPHEQRQSIFPKALEMASIVGIAWYAGALAAIAWLRPIVPDAHCHMIHCCFMGEGRKVAHDIARRFLSQLTPYPDVSSLVALVPVPYRHIRRFACGLGFVEAAGLPGACVMSRRHKPVTGILLTYEVRA